jgi:hypothetical protein
MGERGFAGPVSHRMKRTSLISKLLLPSVLVVAPQAFAEPWLCTGADGVKSFSYEPESARDKRCVDHPIPSANVWRNRPPSLQSPAAFPKVDAKSQKQRDVVRRQILERELAEEQKSLAAAIRELAEYKQARVSYPKTPVGADLKAYEERIRVHETNIANLQKELGREG